MIFIYYTIAAVVLYGISDFILETIEIKMGKRLPNRSLIFFAIISMLAVTTFGVIEVVVVKPVQQPQQSIATENTNMAMPAKPAGEASSNSPPAALDTSGNSE